MERPASSQMLMAKYGTHIHTYAHKSMGTCPLTQQSETNVLTLTPLRDKKN